MAQPSEVETPAPVLCSKCEKNPRADPDSTNPWCKDCKATAHRDYLAGLKKQNAEQAFARGVQADREFLAQQFYRLGTGYFSGQEIGDLMMTTARPKFAD